MEWDIIEGFKKKERVYYRIRYVNGVETKMTSEELRVLNSRALVDYLEGIYLEG
jgi:hypothetical protein